MSDEALSLLREAEPFDPPGGAEDKILERLRTQLPRVLPAPRPVRPPVSLGGPLSLVTLALGIGLGWLLHAQLAQPRIEYRTVEVPVPAPAPTPVTPEPVIVPPPVKKVVTRPAPPAPVKELTGADPDLAREREFIEQARNALVRGEMKAALDALAAHAARFPKGRLAEERDSLWVQSLIRAGNFPEARARAAAFRTDYPNSLLLPAVDAALKSIP